MNSTEQWVSMPGYAGLYEISDHGRIRSFHPSSRRRSEFLKSVLRDDGYLQVAMFKDGIPTTWLVHRAVLFAFVGEPPEGKEGAHRDGDKGNNHKGNLLWATPIENHSHKVSHGTNGAGERNAMAKVTEQIVRAIRSEYVPRSVAASCAALGKRYGLSYQAVWDIVKFRRWKHII
jgi:hypothetical protein